MKPSEPLDLQEAIHAAERELAAGEYVTHEEVMAELDRGAAGAGGERGTDERKSEGYEEMEQIMRAMPPELRLRGIPPEQRLAGIPPEQLILALPDDALRALSEDYLSRLPADTLAAIRKRLGQA